MKNFFPILILAISLAIPDQGRACTCIDEYTTLCETLEGSRGTGSSVFRGVVTRQLGDSIQVEILEMLRGHTFFKEIFIADGDSGTCGLPTRGYQKGEEFLIILPLENGRKTYRGFLCLYNRTLMPIRSGDILYPAEKRLEEPIRIPYRELAEGEVCDAVGSLQSRFLVSPNPSQGRAWIRGLPGAPMLRSIQLYDAAGRPIRSLELPDEYPMETDLSRLPAGVYFLVLAADNRRGVLRIVHAGGGG